MFLKISFRRCSLLILLLFVFAPMPVIRSQAALTGTTIRQVSVYAAPGHNQPVTGQLDPASAIVIEGRDSVTLWALIHAGELQGWIEAGSITLDNDAILRDLPVLTVEPPSYAAPLSSDPAVLAILERLRTTPIFYNLNTERVHEIFRHGQELGNHPGVFTKIGDSNTTSGDFLRPMGFGAGYCEPGEYRYLEETIDFFTAYRFIDGTNSFTRFSKAAYKGFSSSAALDSMWSYRPCKLNETPVECEYRLTKASTVIIMLGLMDVRYSDEEFYKENMEIVLQSLLDNGVIPVLTTIIVLPDQEALSFDTSMVINGALLELAEEYQIPFLNLWSAVQPLPEYGIGPDRTHLRQERGKFCAFDGSEHEIGGTLRNLLTLQVLDELRRNVFTAGS